MGDDPAKAQAAYDAIAQNMNATQLANGAWTITSGIVTDAAKYAAARMLAGPYGTIALVAIDLYGAGRVAIKALKEAYPRTFPSGAISTIFSINSKPF